jgi:AcrR family transcriptional regulator
MDPADQVLDAIVRGELAERDLTARRLGALVGKTTSVLYHRYGSLDAFLYEVAQRGFLRLGERLADPALTLAEAALRYLDFAVEQPVLYGLLFHRRLDWAALRARRDLRASPGFVLWAGLVERLRAGGSDAPELDARVLYAGLHGLASLAISGRANVDDLGHTDRESAGLAARRLVDRICRRTS